MNKGVSSADPHNHNVKIFHFWQIPLSKQKKEQTSKVQKKGETRLNVAVDRLEIQRQCKDTNKGRGKPSKKEQTSNAQKKPVQRLLWMDRKYKDKDNANSKDTNKGRGKPSKEATRQRRGNPCKGCCGRAGAHQ